MKFTFRTAPLTVTVNTCNRGSTSSGFEFSKTEVFDVAIRGAKFELPWAS